MQCNRNGKNVLIIYHLWTFYKHQFQNKNQRWNAKNKSHFCLFDLLEFWLNNYALEMWCNYYFLALSSLFYSLPRSLASRIFFCIVLFSFCFLYFYVRWQLVTLKLINCIVWRLRRCLNKLKKKQHRHFKP